MNVTQLIPNYLGGVSRKPDFDKQPGEVRDAVNAYPDDTYGLLKRVGTEFVGASSTSPSGSWSDWCFFPIIREGRPPYLLGLYEGKVKIWNMQTGAECTVNNSVDLGYTTYYSAAGVPRNQQFKITSDDQRTVLVNRTMETKSNPAANGFYWATDDGADPGDGSGYFRYGAKFQVANSIGELPDSSVKEVRLLNDGDEPSRAEGLLRDGWHIIGTHHDDGECPQATGLTIKAYIENGLIQDGENNGSKQISVYSPGYGYYDKMRLSVDGITGSVVIINTGLRVGAVYRVKQTEASNDDYYMMPLSTVQFTETGDKALKGPFYYLEVPSPDARKGLDQTTLPHELIETGINTFEYKRIDYSDRWAGDDVNNPDPSFVGHTIENVFFSNNRLGFLSQDNVILSRPINYGPPGTSGGVIVPDGNPYIRRNYREVDFYHQSAIQQVPDDPIDLNAASNDVSVFQTAISTPQGIVLFSDGNQSLIYAEQGYLTPATASIRAIAAYDKAPGIDAVLMGSKYYFINKTQKYCRLYEMLNQGMQDPPLVKDVSKYVSDWLPNDLTDLTQNSTNSTVVTFSRGKRICYIYKRFDDENAAWVRWELPAPIENVLIDHDIMVFIMENEGKLYFGKANIFTYPDDNISNMPPIPTIQSGDIVPYLDLISNDATYSGSTITPPGNFPKLTDLTPVVEITDINTSTGAVSDGNASVYDCTWSGNNLLSPVPLVGSITIGYRYNFEVTFPTFYLQQDPSGNAPDYTAYTTISRIKFGLGLSGDAEFLTKTASGIRLPGVTSEWATTYSARLAGDYYADRNPFVYEQRVVEVPIHQRNNNFELKVTSNTHLPLSIDSCMWEGIYSPRYYRRS